MGGNARPAAAPARTGTPPLRLSSARLLPAHLVRQGRLAQRLPRPQVGVQAQLPLQAGPEGQALPQAGVVGHACQAEPAAPPVEGGRGGARRGADDGGHAAGGAQVGARADSSAIEADFAFESRPLRVACGDFLLALAMSSGMSVLLVERRVPAAFGAGLRQVNAGDQAALRGSRGAGRRCGATAM